MSFFEQPFRVVLEAGNALLAWAAALSHLAAAFVATLALVAVVVGARRPMVRIVAAVVGLLLGFTEVARLGPFLQFLHAPGRDLAWGLGGGLALFGLLAPEGIAFAAGGFALGSFAASLVPSNDRTYAFLPGFLVGGAVIVLVFPIVAAAVSSFGGGVLCAVALAALLPRQTLGAYFFAHPLITVGIGLAIGLAGFIGQLNERADPQPAGRKSAERALRKKAA